MDRVVGSQAELAEAVRTLKPGDVLLLQPGTYSGDITIRDVAGTANAPITIRGADPRSRPLLERAQEALHLSNCSYLRLQYLNVVNCSENGITIDDGGNLNTPAHHIIVEHVTISETGPQGNHNSLKLIGVDNVIVRACEFEGWSGSAINMIGCHRGMVENCRFVGRESNKESCAIQIEGGSSNILVQTSFFRWTGDHAIKLGGQTEAGLFRPAAAPYEATDIEVAGNRIFGGQAAFAWVTADGGVVHHNTIVYPNGWVMDIQQGSDDKRFVACRNGRFTENMVLLDPRVSRIVHLGDNTAPETFAFRSNAWYRTAGPKPLRLPGPESDNVQGVDPVISVDGPEAFKVRSLDPRLTGIGADAYTPKLAPFSL